MTTVERSASMESMMKSKDLPVPECTIGYPDSQLHEILMAVRLLTET